ncbi:MAG: hypothetical protein EXQ48_09265 [Acidobacteria bacterium]|nr:hypothetical protein [Acidobacteriota bacterium]
MAVSDDTFVVGAYLDDTPSFPVQLDSGSAYVFVLDGDGDGVGDRSDTAQQGGRGSGARPSLKIFRQLDLVEDGNPRESDRLLAARVGRDRVAEDRRHPIPPALVKVQRREIVVADGDDHPGQLLAACEQLRLGHEMPADARALPRWVGGQGQDVERAVERTPRQRPGDFVVRFRDERGGVIERDGFAVGHELRGTEIAPEQFERLVPIHRRRFTDQDGR